MESKKGPTHRLILANKQFKNQKYAVMSGWPNDFGGINMSPEKGYTKKDGTKVPGVSRIVAHMDDGTTVDFSDHYVEMKRIEERR